ncbi:anthranilate synthase component I family protein [Asticcacaulis sp. 201]|uniref:anthranilate synthase component I family protein n=1 Tax=Asticcacaulis sp. 201 TaxID=3028787 RepID=UPI0029169DCE|nr:anthranilate synthase component I family protein [Asticcacaulis sp. 201]MDV6332066.1 anthranilate synthase component I family protein [Asticcacaulis sp. 201]
MLPFSAIDLSCSAVRALPYEPPGSRLDGWLAHALAAGFLSDGGPLGRYSYLMAEPVARAELTYDDPRETTAFLAEVTAAITPDNEIPKIGDAAIPPFTGGLVGMAAFELGLRLEAMKRRPFRIEGRKAWPELIVLCYPAVLAFDHHHQTLVVIGRGATPAEAAAARDRLVTLYEGTPVSAVVSGRLVDGALCLETPDGVHEDKVAALIQQIHAGDLFQANLARGWTGRLRRGIRPGAVMAALHAAGAAPFGGFLGLDERFVISNSPERFIRLDAGGRLETRPIKGTRPRGRTAGEDRDLAAELSASEKDRAENLMIVDLMRHDLSRVADVGSVTVPALHVLESYPNVHHLVSTVTGQLRADKTAADVIAATFPPGSISGAPKVQAMKVIHEMEAARGPYCGSLFFIDAGGAMDSNVLIRTLAMERDEAGRWNIRACAGGGIVADSVPRAERIETETKLSLIKRVLEG